tara:strand:- start:3232 stop:3489 length:258 start_codon:yes stop_codon:yes gene_type:complete
MNRKKLRVVDYDNRDNQVTELFLDNGDYIEVDVIELYNNLKENQMRDIKKELFEIKGGEFKDWYQSLSKLEKVEYRKILDELGKK